MPPIKVATVEFYGDIKAVIEGNLFGGSGATADTTRLQTSVPFNV